MPKHKLVRHFSTDRALYSDKARSFSQSERALYRNFIIMKYIGSYVLGVLFPREAPTVVSHLTMFDTHGEIRIFGSQKRKNVECWLKINSI